MVSVVSGLKDVRLQRPSILTIFSVLLPGVALVVELSALVPPVANGMRAILDEGLLGIIPETGLTVSVVTLAIGLAYPIGMVSRQIAFKALELVPVRTAGAVMAEFRRAYGSGRIDDVLAVHPMVEHYLNERSSPAKKKGRQVNDDNRFALSYLKHWIEVFAPAMSIGRLETEINILLSIPLPSLLGGILIATKAPFEWATVCAVLVALGLLAGSFVAAVTRRYYELSGAIHHFLMAHEWGLRGGIVPMTDLRKGIGAE